MTNDEEITERKLRYAKLLELMKEWPEIDRLEAQKRGMTYEQYCQWFDDNFKAGSIMNNLEPILRKLIESSLFKYRDPDGKHFWHLTYGRGSLKKESQPDETIDQAIDWFYYAVLQSEHEEEA